MNAKCTGAMVVLALLIVFFAVLPVPQAPQPADWPELDGNTFALRGARDRKSVV